MKFVLRTITTLVMLVGSVLFLQSFTPHPYLVTGLLFAFLRLFSVHLDLELLKAKIELRETSHARLVSRIDRLEWETIYGAFRRVK